MTRRVLAYLSVAALAGCLGGDTARPNSPSFVISDGAHPQDPDANPFFFFLPPMVGNPSANFHPGEFNPNLNPTGEVCVLDVSSDDESLVTLTTPCRVGGYTATFPTLVDVTAEQYAGSWTVPVSADVFYRIRIKLGPDVTLGFADVHSVPDPAHLRGVNQDEFVGRQDGSTIPVKFRIEKGALCFFYDPTYTGPCNSSTFDFEDGGSLGLGGIGSLDVPSQPPGTEHTLTMRTCLDLNPRAIDLPTFGSCIHVEVTPPLDPGESLTNPAILQVCDLAGDLATGGIYSHEQEGLITLHRLDDLPDGSTEVHALPHVAGCRDFASTTPSFKSVLKELARGHLGAAFGKLAAMVGPTPLYARRRRINLGGGGSTKVFSDFQFALPAKMSIYAGNGQFAAPSTTLPVDPAVIVTDLNDNPVANATVHFAPATLADGSVNPLIRTTLTTPLTGIATTSWTLGPATVTGTQTMIASGRGIAGENFDGPRTRFDPFMAIQSYFPGPPDPLDPPAEVLLRTGTRTFSAITPLGNTTFMCELGTKDGSFLTFDKNRNKVDLGPIKVKEPADKNTIDVSFYMSVTGQSSAVQDYPVELRVYRGTLTSPGSTLAGSEVGSAIGGGTKVTLRGDNGTPAVQSIRLTSPVLGSAGTTNYLWFYLSILNAPAQRTYQFWYTTKLGTTTSPDCNNAAVYNATLTSSKLGPAIWLKN